MRASIFFSPPGLCRLAETGREASWRLRVPAAGLNHSGPMSNLQTDLIPGRADRKAGENWVVVVAATSPPPNLPSLLLPAHSPTLIHIRSLKKKKSIAEGRRAWERGAGLLEGESSQAERPRAIQPATCWRQDGAERRDYSAGIFPQPAVSSPFSPSLSARRCHPL